MMTSKEREQLIELNGTAAPHPRDSFKPSSSVPWPRWKREPTEIKPSNNAPSNPTPPSRTTHQSGSNPFGHNLNRRPVGNPTSTQVLGRPNDPPPRKKVKTGHTPHAASTRRGDRNNTRGHEIPIDVDEYCVMPGDNGHDDSSPDELNIRSTSIEGADCPSKYPFNAPIHGSTVRNNYPLLVPDGENTEWAKKNFSQGSSNHINSAPSGQVRGEIAKIEARMGDQRNMIDLKEKLKPKMKTKDNKLSVSKQQPSQRPSQRSSRASANDKMLPLKELCLDDTYHCEKLEIRWTDKIIIKSDKLTIFGPFDIRAHARSLTYHDAPDPPTVDDPVFQLRTLPNVGKFGTDFSCVTVKLDGSSPGVAESYYTSLLDWLKERVLNKEIIRPFAGKSLWGSVAWTGMEFSTNVRVSGKSREDELLQGESGRAKRTLIDDRSKLVAPQKRSASETSMRYTPPSTASDNPKPKQRLRQDTSGLAVVPRRSTRNMPGGTRSPALDSDEVILVYPHGVPGAVNITNGDFLRLQPNEFLNDTLIEFGLKLWLKELEQTNPALASQIHVFNSFFYKKLNHPKKGNINLGYNSVKKWTSKFDIFQKKYIIVPINEHLHWYFAIICDPEHMLVPTAPNPSPSTRQKTRQLISEAMITDEPNETLTASKPVSTSGSTNGKDGDKLGTPSEAEVEDTLHDFQGSCSISNIEPDENVVDLEGERSPSALSYVSDDGDLRPLSPTASDHERAPSRRSSSDHKMTIDGDLPANLETTNHDDPASEISRPVDPAHFYQPKRDKGKRKADPQPESSVMEIDDDGGGGSVPSDTPKTYIFTFDSLGGRHLQAITKLGKYLQLEAADKKKVENPGTADGKMALVPSQPNFWDCGIYLLHLAQTFMTDPEGYRRMILQRSRVPDEERKLIWHAHKVKEKREDLKARIMELSGEWKKERAAKEEAKHKEASNSRDAEVVESDCEIDILEPTPSPSKAKSGGKKKSAASRIRG